MRDLVPPLLESLQAGRPVAYCRLVETRGSTPQKAGATMLVFEDGSQAGTLGGGCVEAEVKRRALAVLVDGRAEVSKFQLDSDYGWDDGLICGGRMQVLIEPITGAAPRRYFAELARLVELGAGVTEAIVFDADASQLPAPASFLFDANDQLVAALHGETLDPLDPTERLPPLVREQLLSLADRPRAYAGRGVAYLPVLPRCRLVIVGGGHVGQAVATLAADLDFDVWVVDDREEIVSRKRFPRASQRIAGDLETVLPQLEVTPNTYCLIVTRGHNHDERALYHIAPARCPLRWPDRQPPQDQTDLRRPAERRHPPRRPASRLRPRRPRHRLANRPRDRRQHLRRTHRPPQSRQHPWPRDPEPFCSFHLTGANNRTRFGRASGLSRLEIRVD